MKGCTQVKDGYCLVSMGQRTVAAAADGGERVSLLVRCCCTEFGIISTTSPWRKGTQHKGNSIDELMMIEIRVAVAPVATGCY